MFNSISPRNIFFTLLFLYDCFFAFHLVNFYSAKPADDYTYQPFYGYPQHRLPLEHPLWLVYVHASCAIPMILGNFQFIPSIRKNHMWLHKAIGWFYVVLYVIGAIGPLCMLSSMSCSEYLKVFISILGIGWMSSTILAVVMVKKGSVILHRQWMARSFLLSHTIPLLFRFFWIIAVVLFHVEEVPAFEVAGWMIVVVTVPLAELMAFLESPTERSYLSIFSKRSYLIPKLVKGD